jgi:hypothetical protein
MQFDEGVLDGACGDAVELGNLSQLDFIQLRSITNCVSEAFEQGAWHF